MNYYDFFVYCKPSLKLLNPGDPSSYSTQIGLDWLCYLAGNSQMGPTISFKFSGYIFFHFFIKNPQTTIALTFLTHNISDTGGVESHLYTGASRNILSFQSSER